MPTREQVWDAAAAVRRSGERINQENVLVALRARGIGATQRTISAALTKWKVAEGYEPRPDRKAPPQRLADLHVTFVKRIWDAAVAETSARLDDVRVRLERERDAMGQLLDETHIRAEETERANEELRARQGEMDIEMAELRKEVAHLRKTEFWDRVIREIVEFLPEREWMTTAEIARRLPSSFAN